MSAAAWFIVLGAVFFANLPFVNQRFFGVVPLPLKSIRSGKPKSAWIRLLELVIAYFIVGIFGHMLEAQAGNAFEQGWQFYAVTFSLFVVFAFPGFTARYLVHYRV